MFKKLKDIKGKNYYEKKAITLLKSMGEYMGLFINNELLMNNHNFDGYTQWDTATWSEQERNKVINNTIHWIYGIIKGE